MTAKAGGQVPFHRSDCTASRYAARGRTCSTALVAKGTYGIIDKDYATRLATTPTEADGPIWMVNLMKYRAVADYGAADGQSTVSGREADDRYAPVDVLADIGAEVVLFGDVDTQLLGADPTWDRVGVVRYPTRRSFIEMQSRPDFRDRHVHKAAGMEQTIVMGCLPGPDPLPADRLVDWKAVPHPPTTDDPPVVVVHVIKFTAAGRPDMESYQDKAAESAVPAGVRIGGWFDVEGTIIGDGRAWDQVRFNVFPSRAAFMAVVTDPARLEAQRTHREPAMADTYTLIVRPGINRLLDA